jgi:hypothetical protein
MFRMLRRVHTEMSWITYTLNSHRQRSQGWTKDPVTLAFPRIFIGDGARLSPAFMELYRITHVINCADPSACRIDLDSEKYVCLNAVDHPSVNIFEWYPQFKETMDKFLRDPSCLNVYVHCQCGINRSVFLTIAYIVKTFRIPLETCILRVVRERPCVMTNVSFQKQLIQFAKNSD